VPDTPVSWKPGSKPAPDPLAGVDVNDPDFTAKLQSAIGSLTAAAAAGIPPALGSRKDEYLPFIVIRGNPGDRGTRPISGVFWESPDIFIAPNIDAASAPLVPTTLAGLAQAGAPNTLWVHVWNVGLAPVANARVEFYWYEPTVGPDASNAHLIGVTHVSLGNRHSGRSHTIVKCPTTWYPTYVNEGHECVIVRCSEPLLDALGPNPWQAWDNRHVAQRNIHVATARSPASVQMSIRLGCASGPGPAKLEIIPVRADEVSWLSILGQGGRRLHEASHVKETYGLMHPTPLRNMPNRLPAVDLDDAAAGALLRRSIEFERGCDELETVLYVRVSGLGAGECKVYRVRQTADGRVLGGYTVIVRGP